MSEKRDGIARSTDSSSLDKTTEYEQADNARSTTVSESTSKDDNLDATFVPDSTSASQPPKSSEPKKSGSNQLGKYKLVKKLGHGGMGEVYLAEDTKLGRKAAVKVLSKAFAGRDDFVARFYKEARAMARVNHENAVSVFDVDQDHGIHYVAMEFVDGKSMQKWMDSQGKLSVGDALHVTLRCAEALQIAHGQNLIHRDIKPDNIMLTSKGKVKVTDFGLAKATDEDLSMTASGTGLGTPYYMAPEQARNAKHVDGRTDIYALGITLYYFLTGKLPFGGESAAEVILAKEKGRYESIRKLNPQVSDKLDLVIGKMIDKDRDHRFKDCDELIRTLSGLGMDSPSLSFIDAPDRFVHTSSTASQSSRLGQSAASRPAGTGVPRTSAADAAASAQSRPTPANSNSATSWIVQYKNAQGKETIGKFTTVQVLTALKNGTLDVKSKLKKNASETFAPIAFFPEFERIVEGRNIKEKAEKKTAGLKADFAKIGREYDRRGWTRYMHNLASGTAGFISFLVWITIVFGGLGAVIYFRATLWDAFANFYNSRKG